jgi:PhnB protein
MVRSKHKEAPMATAKKPVVRPGYNKVMPYLRVKGAQDAITFYKAAFGAKEKFRLMMPDGRLGHAELWFGDSLVMLSEEFPEMGIIGPKTLKGTTFTLSIYVADVDKAAAKAQAAGAKLVQPPADQFYGDRTAKLDDPFGHSWSLQAHIEDVTPKQMQKRLDAMMGVPPKKKGA